MPEFGAAEVRTCRGPSAAKGARLSETLTLVHPAVPLATHATVADVPATSTAPAVGASIDSGGSGLGLGETPNDSDAVVDAVGVAVGLAVAVGEGDAVGD